jgi:4-hydroxy-2-oxoheptanedioate aldolase
MNFMDAIVRNAGRSHIREPPNRGSFKRMETMKTRLAAGETLFGTFLTLGSPFAAESLGLLGWDWLLVDLEHGGGDESLLLGQLMGCSSAGVHALVRVEADTRGRTARALDLGVEGVMCPQINSRAQAEAWAGALHYGPQGSRGIALFHRGARYGTDPDAIEHSRQRICGIAQIESPEAVEAVEEIAAVDGVDVLFVGPSDLSYSMGMFRDFENPRFRDAITRVNDAARAANKATGIFLTAPEQVAPALADGFRMIALGSDGGYMMAAARATLATARAATAG